MKTHAVFAVWMQDGNYVAVTRPGGVRIGFPGGKLERGEGEIEALYRECEEEGVIFGKNFAPILIQTLQMDGKIYKWFWMSKNDYKFTQDHKEAFRGIRAEIVDEKVIVISGLGNRLIPAAIIRQNLI